MKTLTNVLIAAAMLALTGPALAAGTTAKCEHTYDEVVALFALGGHPVAEVPADKLKGAIAEIDVATGEQHPNVTRVFSTTYDGRRVLGAEENGCMLDPIPLDAKPGLGA